MHEPLLIHYTGAGDFIAGSSYERFRRILSERVRWNRASGG